MVKVTLCKPSTGRILMMERMDRCFRDIGLMAALVTTMTCAGQGGLLRLMVIDSLQGLGIAGVHVNDRADRPLAVTDGQGRCALAMPAAGTELRFSHVSYAARAMQVDARADRELVIRLVPKVVELPVAEVVPDVPEEVFRSEELNVAEFEINEEGIWVLAYDHPRLLRDQANAGVNIYRDVVLILLDTLFRERARMPVMGEALGLRRDHRGRIYLELRHEALLCGLEKGRIACVHFTNDDLHRRVLPWTDSIPGWLIGNNEDGTFPAFDHIAWDPVREEERVLCSVQDDFTMELFRSQYKYMSGHDKVIAMDLAREYGVDKQIIAGYMTGFQHDLYFHAPYAPLFVVNDTLCVFDHDKGRIRRFSSSFRTAGEVPITYHLRNLWKGRLMQDRATEDIHLTEMKHGIAWIARIDPRTGSLGEKQELKQRFPERIAINDGYVYYVYRPYASQQTRTLYRERVQDQRSSACSLGVSAQTSVPEPGVTSDQ